MGRVYNVFDKFSIIDIIVGLALGIYLETNQNSTNLWHTGFQFALIFAGIMTLIPIAATLYAKIKRDEKIPIRALIEAFVLNFAMIGVCLAFGVVIGSLLVGNFIIG